MTTEDAIGDITLEHLIEKAAGGDKEALDPLINHYKVIQLLNEISAWAEWKYRQDREDFRQIMVVMICINIHTIVNPRRLKPWCYSTARHYCLNEIRHRKVESSGLDKIKDQYMVQASSLLTPEQILLKKERESLRKDALRRVTARYPEWLVSAWSPEKETKDIIRETGKPASTVYRLLREMQQEIIREVGIEPYEK